MLMRWISALGGLAVLFGTLYFFGASGLAAVGSIIIFIAACEYSLLFEKPSSWFFIFLTTDFAVYLTHLFYPQFTLASLVASFLILSTLGVFLFRNLDNSVALKKIQWALWGVMYTALLPALSVKLMLDHGWTIIIYLLVTVFFGDVAAFFCGRYIGGPKIFPNISPKKTISGAIGGLTASGVFGLMFLLQFAHFPNIAIMLLLSLVIGFFAQFGDFFESLIKRVSGKKDAGQIMPGHGGFLDRLDGVYFGSAVLYFFCSTLDFITFF